MEGITIGDPVGVVYGHAEIAVVEAGDGIEAAGVAPAFAYVIVAAKLVGADANAFEGQAGTGPSDLTSNAAADADSKVYVGIEQMGAVEGEGVGRVGVDGFGEVFADVVGSLVKAPVPAAAGDDFVAAEGDAVHVVTAVCICTGAIPACVYIYIDICQGGNPIIGVNCAAESAARQQVEVDMGNGAVGNYWHAVGQMMERLMIVILASIP